MINLYGLAYKMPNYLKSSLDSLIKNASEEISIYVGENRSDRSPEVQELIKSYVDRGKVKAAFFFEANTIGWGFTEMIRAMPPGDMFLMTDLDLSVPEGCDYIKIIKDTHTSGAVLTGCTLDISNYTDTPNHGYSGDGDGFGCWLMGLNTEIFNTYGLDDRAPVDHIIRAHFAERGRVEKLLDIRLYHWAWDLWKDDPDYFWWKKNNPMWCYGAKPENMKYELYTSS